MTEVIENILHAAKGTAKSDKQRRCNFQKNVIFESNEEIVLYIFFLYFLSSILYTFDF